MEVAKQIEITNLEFNNLFEESVKKVLQNQAFLYKNEDFHDEELLSAIISYSSGGKRIRPFIVKLFSDNDFQNEDLINASLAFELFHLAALIHDDIIDEAEMRRNSETIHVFLNKFSKNNKNLGRDLAIIWGDIFLSESIFYASKLKEETRGLFYEMIMRTMRGQYTDIINSNEEYGSVNEKSVDVKNELKTAWYTFTSPMLIGISLKKQPYENKTLDKIKEISIGLGKLFQIRDDIIDCQDVKSGKKLFGDIFENQTTWVTLELIKNYPDIFNKIKDFAGKKKNEQDINYLKEVFKDVDLNSKYNYEKQKIDEIIKNSEIPEEIKTKFKDLSELLSL